MKTYSANLQADIVASYDKTKTYRTGRFTQKTLPAPYNSGTVLSCPLSKFIDLQTDSLAATTAGFMYYSNAGRLYILQPALVAGLANNIAMYNFNATTGAATYVGRILFSVASATAVPRGFQVDDSDSSNIKIFIGYTATVVATGGLMMINKVNVANFTFSGTQFYTAQGNDVAGCYNLNLPNEVGGANLMTTLSGLILPSAYCSNVNLNTKVFAHNGISATHQYNVFDYSSAPNLASLGTSTVTANNTTGVSTTFTMAGNTLSVGDPVIITSNAPTGYTNSLVNTIQTIYFVVATNFVSGSTFSLSLTQGGAILAATSAVGTTTFARALGASTNLAVAKTANLPTFGAGTLLLTNSENYCVPGSGANSGFDCGFAATSTNFHQFKLEELWSEQSGTTNGTTTITGLSSTAGLNIGQTVFGTGIPALTTISSIVSPTSITINLSATTSTTQTLRFGANSLPSLQTVNVLGNGIDYVLPLPIYASYSSSTDKVVYPVAGTITLIKNFVNSMMLAHMGNTGNTYMEAQNHVTDYLQLQAITGFELNQGWAFYASSATIGQRGIIAVDLRSDSNFEYSYVTTPVIATPGLQTLVGVKSIEKLFDFTGGVVFQYRTSADISDVIFDSPTGGWIDIDPSSVYNISLSDFTQFRMLSSILSTYNEGLVVTTHPQIVDLQYTTELLAEISDYWDYSYNDSSSAIPTRIGFNLRTEYATGVVPKLYFRAYDIDGNVLTTANTVDDIANFQYSTDDGLTWLSLGTIPNVKNTRIRYTYTTPPGVDIRVSLKES